MNSNFEELVPSTALAESVRNFGYDLNTAISDIIDNSITAGASEISIWLDWNEGNPAVSILDNGHGMTDEELSKNIVIGSKDPSVKREKNDLGRFGLGLKTASFSMCRELNVFSKTSKTNVAFRSWDLDIIREQQKWIVLKVKPQWYEQLENILKIGESGTLVLWKKCDRLSNVFDTETKMKETGVDLISHLATYFFRFLAGKNKIEIKVNNTKVRPWNPIPENSRFLGAQSISDIIIKPYIVPQKSAFSDRKDFEEYGGIKGWNAQQGFYVYRNNRLLVNGGWLRFKNMKLDEHTKLARIVIELDSTHDIEWSIDVSKSKALVPPGGIKDFIQAIAKKTRKEAEEVYRHKSKVVSRTQGITKSYIWETTLSSSGDTQFKINKSHPIVTRIYEKYGGSKKDLNVLFSMLEKLLPTENIHFIGNKGTLDVPEIALEDILDLAKECIELQTNIGKSRKNAFEDMITAEPFSQFKNELKEALEIL